MRQIALLIVGLALSASFLTHAQSLSFEVVSVKPTPPGTQNGGVQISPSGRVTWTNVTLQAMVTAAYQRSRWDSGEIVGGPDWFDEARFDVVAVAPGGLPRPDADGFPSRLLAMIRAVLEDRFKLVVHWETRERPIYNLVLDRADGRLGPKLVPVTVDCAKVGAAIVAGTPPVPRPGRGQECNFSLTSSAEPGSLQGNAVTMAVLAGFLGVEGDGREVVDRTGLSGTFDIDLLYFPELPSVSAEKLALDPKFAGRAGLVTSLREQLGLKLEPARGSVEVLVIDRAEWPTEN
ncbi:MAG TPA: TIGR03435 family protein [Vicinamibacterales bacterium]|nr:TIGR03435 family protein [Vicinamibacterales bacterium]